MTANNGNFYMGTRGSALVGNGDLNLTASSGSVNFLTSMRVPTRTVTSGFDSASATDHTVKWNKAIGSASLENIPACAPSITGRVYVFKDGKGDANANNITIAPVSGTIDGASTYVIRTAYGAVSLQCDGGSDWSVIAKF
jgi:hypothetical protein